MFNDYNLNEILSLIHNKNSLISILENIVNSIMLAERDFFLKQNPDQYANGLTPKVINTKFDRLNLSVPRTRTSDFTPYILPDKYKRNDDSFFQMLQSLIIFGNSKNKIKSILKHYNLNFSEELYDFISEDIDNKDK